MRVLLSSLLTAAITLGFAAPADAAPHYSNPPTVHLGYTDLRTPTRAHDTRPMPVGSWKDSSGRRHVSRVYITFDLSAYAGRTITDAALSLPGPDCTGRLLEVWETRPISANPSWLTAPAPVQLIGTAAGCAGVDLTTAVRRSTRLSLEIRVPAGQELDLSYGRRLDSVPLIVGYNTAPVVDPRWTSQNYRGCGAEYLSGDVRLEVRGDDADGDWVTSQFEYWPVDRPTEVTTLDGYRFVELRELAEDRTYAWRGRVGDGVDFSPWTPTCQFTVDDTRPASPPQVTSANYDPVFGTLVGGTGEFTFAGTDAVGYQYSWGELSTPGCEILPDGYACPPPTGYVPGATATVQLTIPDGESGTLKIRSFDRAGNASDTVELSIMSVPSGPPGVASPDYPEGSTPSGGVGVPGTFIFTDPTGMTVVGYQWVLGDQAGEVSGDSAVITPSAGGTQTLSVAAVLDTGQLSAARHYVFTVSTAD